MPASTKGHVVVPGEGIEVPTRQKRQQLAGKRHRAKAITPKSLPRRTSQLARDKAPVELHVVGDEDAVGERVANPIADVAEGRRLVQHWPGDTRETLHESRDVPLRVD